ncbi:MAG: toll/interleukin-1 receptor domain-containing protein [Oscillospiraceae bacterium]|nr:toll/interleukin-1 receptor domain-containing protein [Oscillospiraceae bacterium]
MGFIKLPSNSEKILLELAQAENPTQVLNAHYECCSIKERNELDGIVRELKEFGYINVKWADNMPWIVMLNNSARTYGEQLAEYESQKMVQAQQKKKVKNIIFISHRSTDKEVADMLVDFFSGTGIPKDKIFCSSLPGNDINEKISGEVKNALKNSAVNIVILSQSYYDSAYCLNEAGVLWYEDVPVIPVALPEITPNNMYGFLNNEYKLRHLDCDTDISYIYDKISEAISVPQIKFSIVTNENNKLRARYADYLRIRELPESNPTKTKTTDISEVTTDDERIVLYYILQKKVRKIHKENIEKWLEENEIYDVNVDNAFDLLSTLEGGKYDNGVLELGIEIFRKYSANTEPAMQEFKKSVDSHTKLSTDVFGMLWESGKVDTIAKLFVAYIIEEKIETFGDRWMADMQIESIKQWEDKNTLDSELSSNYGSCLGFFIQNGFVYESDWTSYGNPRSYTLQPSLKKYLFECPDELIEELQRVKNEHDFLF